MNPPLVSNGPLAESSAASVSWAGDHPYAAFLAAVTKPARYIGGEHGQRRPEASGREGADHAVSFVEVGAAGRAAAVGRRRTARRKRSITGTT